MLEKAYDHPAVSATYFFPRRRPLPAAVEGAGPLALSLPDGTPLAAYHCQANQGAPTILYLYGNGESIPGTWERWAAWAVQLGVNLLLVDYPGYGQSGGRACFSACALAVETALQHLLSLPEAEVPGVVLLGRSAGSIFALHALSRCPDPRVRGVVLESAVACPGERILLRAHHIALARPVVQEAATRLSLDFNHRQVLESIGVPVLVIHTQDDEIVPVGNARRLASWAGDRLSEMVIFPRGGHNGIQQENADAYRSHLADFLESIGRGQGNEPDLTAQTPARC